MVLSSHLAARKDAAPQGAEPAAQPVPGRSVNLTKKLISHKGEVWNILLREPTLQDYILLGDIDTPVASDFEEGTGRPTVLRTQTDFDALMGWAAALSGFDRHILGQLNPRDAGELLAQVRLSVAPFTKDVPLGKSKSAPTNSSSSSALDPSSSPALA